MWVVIYYAAFLLFLLCFVALLIVVISYASGASYGGVLVSSVREVGYSSFSSIVRLESL